MTALILPVWTIQALLEANKSGINSFTMAIGPNKLTSNRARTWSISRSVTATGSACPALLIKISSCPPVNEAISWRTLRILSISDTSNLIKVIPSSDSSSDIDSRRRAVAKTMWPL
ncbi:hypothetical protein BDP27DRAFT_1330616, partial [Rhodocollybia butyracea]